MEVIDILKHLIIPCLLLYIGYNERDKHKMKDKTEHDMSREETEKLIDMKLEVPKVKIREIKGDLVRIEAKLDMILNRILKAG